MPRPGAIPVLLAALFAALTLGGCAIPANNAEARFEPAQYRSAFNASRDVLRDYRFTLERVDARSGVLTTRPKATAGFFSIWDREQSSVGDEIEDVMHRQRRIVRVTFIPEGAIPPEDAASGVEQVLAEGDEPTTPVVMRVLVTIERIQRPGWRLEPAAIQLSSIAYDPTLINRDMQPNYSVAISEDRDFAARLTDEIRARVGQ